MRLTELQKDCMRSALSNNRVWRDWDWSSEPHAYHPLTIQSLEKRGWLEYHDPCVRRVDGHIVTSAANVMPYYRLTKDGRTVAETI